MFRLLRRLRHTFSVGALKGVGRLCQQTFVDTDAKVGVAKLSDVKTAITAADLLNDRVLPFSEEHGIPLCRALTDRGSEYCGSPERHADELSLAIENIDPSRTQTKSPQTNGQAERFHKTMLDEFYRVAFCKKLRPQPGRAAGRSVAPPGQPSPHAPRPMVLRQDADADRP